jgi:hypothetical protein
MSVRSAARPALAQLILAARQGRTGRAVPVRHERRPAGDPAPPDWLAPSPRTN